MVIFHVPAKEYPFIYGFRQCLYLDVDYKPMYEWDNMHPSGGYKSRLIGTTYTVNVH